MRHVEENECCRVEELIFIILSRQLITTRTEYKIHVILSVSQHFYIIELKFMFVFYNGV